MEDFADYILNEQDLVAKMEIMYYLAKKANNNSIDYFCFNNRGSDIVKFIKKNENGKRKKCIGGMAFEDVLECHHDVIGAINKMKELGYTEIYLQGHSLGSTKVVYSYNKLY